jgi:hypothetical protein
VITGFNTDIEHEGVVYHVQTEDKGLETPIILSLVYVGGAIHASKRSPYDDLVVAGFDVSALGERLNRQHKLICAAITAGRIEELKRLSRPGEGIAAGRKNSRKASPVAQTAVVNAPSELAEEANPSVAPSAQTDCHVPSNEEGTTHTATEAAASALPTWLETTAESLAAPSPQAAAPEMAEPEQPRHLPPSEAHVAAVTQQPFEGDATLAGAGIPLAVPELGPRPEEPTEIIAVEVEGELHVSLMEERDYKAGEIVTLRVRVARGPLEAREAVPDAVVTVKILGTEFRPLILTSKTDRDGVAVIHAWLPRFTSGRAAILIRAAHDGFSAEMRRAVRHL